MSSSSSKDSDLSEEDGFEARDYQLKLLQHALASNVLIYLPTGSGKTFIAIMALKHMSKDVIGSFKDGAQRSIFICNTVALTLQQGDVLKKNTNLKVGVYTGLNNVDSWKRDRWEVEFENNQVIMATCQIVVDCIRHGYLSVSQINLIIVDECHHAMGGHPIVQLMRLFQTEDPKKLPRVIGLTGTLLKAASKSKIVEDLDKLEAVFRAKIITVENMNEHKNVLLYSTKAKEIVIKYHYNGPTSTNLTERIKALITECKMKISKWNVDESHFKYSKNLAALRLPNPITTIVNMLNDFIYQMDDMGIYAASVAIMSVLVELEIKKRGGSTSIYRNLIRCVITYVEFIRHLIVKSIYDEDDPDETEADVILNSSSAKLNTFLQFIQNEFRGKRTDEIKCLVFVQRRYTAKCLFHILKRFVSCRKDIPIIPDFMVGHNSPMPDSIESILENKWSRKILDNFQRNTCNLIVASSVLEEGIDIQSCNYVLVFDEIKTFSSYVQTKGRARMSESTYGMFVSEEKIGELTQKIRNFKEIDAILKQYLIEKTIDRKIPLQAQTDKEFVTVIEPFVTPIGARLEGDSAVQLLNRYCMGLPNDSFTISSVQWKKVLVEPKKIIVSVTLPMQSTIKHRIHSDPMINMKWAKQSAAFNACKLLYQQGELNDNLLPITEAKCVDMVSPTYFSHWSKYADDLPHEAGSKKKRRLYAIQYPKELTSAIPEANRQCYFYSINLEPKFSRTEANAHIIDLFATTSHYAIVTAKPLPKLAAMPLFMSQGEIVAKITWTPVIGVIPTVQHLATLRNFHIMVFRDVCGISKSFLANDFTNKENSFLIAPMRTANEIDWSTVQQFQNLSEVCEATDMQRSKKIYRPEDYLGKIIAQWYLPSDTVRFVVTKILSHLTPVSPFPNDNFQTFADYFENKYELKVRQPQQFMIEVEPITQRRNFLQKAQNEEGGRKPKPRQMQIFLIPEFCHNFEYPGDLWLKALFLPSILHRLNCMLLAEQLRNDINRYVNITATNYNPKSLIVDSALSRVGIFKSTTKPSTLLPSLPIPDKPLVINENYRLVNDSHYVPWKSYKTPIDLNRNMENLHILEVDYYQKFIEKMISDVENIKISEKNTPVSIPFVAQHQHPAAIMDVSTTNRSAINILNITPQMSKTPEQWEFLAAITSSGANDVFDMERVEVLGDSFLKFSISFYLLRKYPNWNEGYLSTVKGKFVSNRNLLYLAIEKSLPGMLVASAFNAKGEWCPPLFSVPTDIMSRMGMNGACRLLYNLNLNDDEISTGQCQTDTLTDFANMIQSNISDPLESDLHAFIGKKVVSDKVCADSVEGILGVCVQNFGITKSLLVLEYFGIVPKGENITELLRISLGNPRVRANTSDREIDAFLVNYDVLEANLGYKFNDRAYLLQALTHPSFPTNQVTGCYQQLEFIGDAILDFLVTCYIFERCKSMDPGKLTDLRSALVNNVTLACITVRCKFHLHILSHNMPLSQAIARFCTFQEEQNFKVNDQIRFLRSESEVNSTMADYVDVPKTLGDIFEALIGAVFLDCKNDLQRTWQVIYHLMSQEINEFIANVPIQCVRQLYEYKGADPVFSAAVVEEDMVMIKCTFTLRNEKREAFGFGKNAVQAKCSAAKLALQELSQH